MGGASHSHCAYWASWAGSLHILMNRFRTIGQAMLFHLQDLEFAGTCEKYQGPTSLIAADLSGMPYNDAD